MEKFYQMNNIVAQVHTETSLSQKKAKLLRFWVNTFTNGNPILGTNLLAVSIGRGLGALKGLKKPQKVKSATFIVALA